MSGSNKNDGALAQIIASVVIVGQCSAILQANI